MLIIFIFACIHVTLQIIGHDCSIIIFITVLSMYVKCFRFSSLSCFSTMLSHVCCWQEAAHTVPVTSHISHAYICPAGASSTQCMGTEKMVVVFDLTLYLLYKHTNWWGNLLVIQTHKYMQISSLVHKNRMVSAVFLISGCLSVWIKVPYFLCLGEIVVVVCSCFVTAWENTINC